MEKSGEQAIPHQFLTPALVQADQLVPPFTEKYMLLPHTVAASLAKSGVEVIETQFLLPALVLAVHVTPLSVDMYIEPPNIVAAMYRKSGEAVMPCQSPLVGVETVTVVDGYDPAGTCTHAELPIALL